MTDPLLQSPDVRVDIFSNISGHSVRLTHLPSGVTVESGWTPESQFQVKQQLAAELRQKLSSNTKTRVSVDGKALDALIEYADGTRLQRDQEFCVGVAEHQNSDREFAALVDALDRHPSGDA